MTTAARTDRRLLEDAVRQARQMGRELSDGIARVGYGVVQVIGPDGELKDLRPFANLITDVGDEYFAKRAASVAINVPTGMRYGTGTTAVAKNGAGAAIVTYVSGSQKAFDGSFPAAASKGAGAGWRTSYQCTWAAGTATANAIAEAVITNETPITNVAGTAANTISRALLSPVVNKDVGDQLIITWHHDSLGA